MEPKFKSENYVNLGGINTKTSPYTTGPQEFMDLSNFDFTQPGSLTKRYGFTQYSTATVVGRITGLYEFERLNGSSYIIATANTNAYTVTSGAFTPFRTGLLNGAIFDFVTFVDRLFAANGNDFFKYDGTVATNYSLPPGVSAGLTAVQAGSGGMSGIFRYSYGYLNDRGYLGPCGGDFSIGVSGAASVTVSGFSTYAGYGITAIAVYRTSAGGSDFFRIGFAAAGASLFSDVNFALTSEECVDGLWFTMAPRYLEIYNNRLFMAGFSSQLSTVWFSELGEPESVMVDSNFEVRTNDGDRITGLKAFSGKLMIFKQKSYHSLTGDSPESFLLREESIQYGCLSNRAIAAYEDYLMFLDQKGVIEYNGANTKVVSTRVEPIFNGINFEQAIDNATSVHNRIRNEIWFSIPCQGSTQNNCTIVYDYNVDAWTKFEGFQPSSLAIATGGQSTVTSFFGSYSGSVFNFATNLLGDNGLAYTALAQTRFLADMGNSITKQFRRFYLDITPVLGMTSALSIRVRQDYGASIIVSRTMYQAPFQSRIDFGVPAKSLSFEMVNTTATDPVRIHGYSVEFREQRKV